MKKCIVFVCVFLLLTPFLKASKTKKWLGWGLLLTGIVLAADGYQKVDISNPRIDISNWTYSKTKAIFWYVDSNGVVKNTGNVSLNNIKIYRKYYNGSGSMIANDYCFLDVHWLDSLSEGVQDSWNYINGGWVDEPTKVDVSVTYDYNRIYKSKNESEGIAGIIVGSVGVYLLINDFMESKKLANKYGLNINMACNSKRVDLIFNKKFNF